jgi:hypothetical protein
MWNKETAFTVGINGRIILRWISKQYELKVSILLALDRTQLRDIVPTVTNILRHEEVFTKPR